MQSAVSRASQASAETPQGRHRVADHVRAIGAETRNLDEPVRRLIISKVVLRNFKSYGGTTVIGPFHKRFTSIVGPNGSGKSNVIDAMLFVFGFRAKQMRFDKLADLIHNSQAYLKLNKGQPLQSMEVAVHFCEIIDRDPDADEFEVVPGSELVIAREVHRDNTSRYRINGRTATQKDVSNSLKSFGMDLYNNRFLILQGEVEQIAQMKPKATKPEEEGLLEYLEDIIGTNQYLEAIKAAQEEYEAVQDQCQERLNRARVAQKEMEDLLEPKREADEYIAKEKALLQAQVLLTRKEIGVLETRRSEATEKLALLEKRFQESTAELDAVQRERSAAAAGIQGVESELESVDRAKKRLSDSLQRMIAKDEDLRKQLLREVKKVEEKTASIKKSASSRPKLEREAKERLARSEELLEQVPSMQADLERAEQALETLTEQLKPELLAANQVLAKCEADLAPMQQAYDQAQKEIRVLQSSINLLDGRRKEGESNLQALRSTERKLSDSLNAHKGQLSQQEAELRERRATCEADAGAIAEMEATVRSKSQWCTQKRGEYESMKRELDDMVGSSDQYRYIMGLVASGKMRGVHGRLGDLGSIAPEYERAFMAAGGGQVDTLVVDTPDVASQVFDELRRRNLGRSSAMALSVLNHDLRRQMEAFERSSQDKLPAGVQYLVQLVQPSQPNYKVCFFSALRDTLLAPDLEVATRVGYQQRRRVVTLDGELIEPDGRMSGGGIRPRKGGGISTKADGSAQGAGKPAVDAAQLEALLKDIERESTELRRLKEELGEKTLRHSTLSKSVSELQYSVEVLQHTVVNEEVQLGEISQQVSSLESATTAAADEAKLVGMRSDLEEKQRAAAAAAARVADQEKFVADAYRVVDSVGKGKLRGAKERVSDLEAKLSETRATIERLRKESAGLQADADKCQRDAEKFIKEIALHQVREAELEQQLNELEEEAAAVSAEMNEVGAKVDALKKQLRDLKGALAAKDKVIEEHNLKSVDMRHSIDELSKQVRSCDHQLEEHQARLRNVTAAYKKTRALIQSSLEVQALMNQGADGVATDGGAEGAQAMVILDEDGELILDDDDVDKADALQGDSGGVSDRGSGVTSASSSNEAAATDSAGAEDNRTPPDDDEATGTPGYRQLRQMDIASLRERVEQLRREAGAVPNLSVLDEFGIKAREYNRRRDELRNVQARRDEVKRTFDQLCFKRKSEFLENFAVIAAKLKEMYQAITLGGDAELELVDSTDPFTEGILFSVRPARKSWKQIQNLSGGEKTLSSLALVFALHHYKPNPVYFMDEIDAALDFRNVSIIAQNIKERTKDAQFIIISLRSQMFEMCNQMVGIYKTADVTKSVCINPAAFENLFSDDDSPTEDAGGAASVDDDDGRLPELKLEPAAMCVEDPDPDDDGIDLCSTEALVELSAGNPSLLIPSVLPGAIDTRVGGVSTFTWLLQATDSGVMEFLSTPGTHFVHIQMPNAMPNLDKERTLRGDAGARGGRCSEHLLKREAASEAPEESQIYQTSRVGSLPSGRLGRLRVHRSGKIKLHLGEHVFNFAAGNSVSCKQRVGCLLEENDEFMFLGDYRKKFVVSPDFTAMFRDP
ncbi:chromosome condensation protein [Babesia caballi]|uniref:Structural maintenance of chromosomes protein 4 n=1 Tax=Babesia caballi TaxID=5871 RepID=A0AAV4LYH0_BABCB|nr:chromosome condensation protein [Babesia caballi]